MIGDPRESMKFSSQTTEVSNSSSYRTNRAPQNNTDKKDGHNDNANMPDYFSSSTNCAVDKRASKVLTNKIHYEFSDVFGGLGLF